ncbi:hypothetical protein V8D89_002226 [Ganoderma adspersum]
MGKLILDHCDSYPTAMSFIRGFPNLVHLRVCGGGGAVFDCSREFGEQLQAFRDGNVRVQLESGTTWRRLEKRSSAGSSSTCACALGLVCPIPRVAIKYMYTWLGASHLEMLRDVLAQPEETLVWTSGLMRQVLDVFDLVAFTTGLLAGVPTLKDAVIGLCYPSQMDEMGERVVRIAEGGVQEYVHLASSTPSP